MWRDAAAKAGFELNTWDMKPVASADVLWFINLPRTKREFLAARLKASRAKTVLQLNESPLLSPLMFHPQNQRHFDYIVSYDADKCDDVKTFAYRLPTTVTFPSRNPAFGDRKILCMVNSNRVEGWLGMRQRGLDGLPGIGRLFTGWHVEAADIFFPLRGSLYGERRALCREAEKFLPAFLDIYGSGWNGEQISWCPLYSNRPYQCFRKRFVEDKIEVMCDYRFNVAFENYRGRRGYIDIKIFDSFLAGSVPVYLGEERITDYVPAECFVDARKFKTYRDLLEYLRDCPEKEWRNMREAGQEFIHSDKIKPFTDEAFAERMTEILLRVASD